MYELQGLADPYINTYNLHVNESRPLAHVKFVALSSAASLGFEFYLFSEKKEIPKTIIQEGKFCKEAECANVERREIVKIDIKSGKAKQRRRCEYAPK